MLGRGHPSWQPPGPAPTHSAPQDHTHSGPSCLLVKKYVKKEHFQGAIPGGFSKELIAFLSHLQPENSLKWEKLDSGRWWEGCRERGRLGVAQPPLPCSARLASMGWGRQGAGWARAQGAGPLSTVAGPRGGLRRTEARWMASEVKPRGHRTRCLQLLGLTCEEATSAPTEWGCGLLLVPPAPPWDARVPGRGFQGCRAGGLGEQGWRPGSESPALPLRGHPMLLPPRGAAQLWDTPLVCMSGCLGSGWACAGVCRGDGPRSSAAEPLTWLPSGHGLSLS